MRFRSIVISLAAITIFSIAAQADQFVVGLFSWDVIAPGNFAKFDISNQTGANSSAPGDPTFPVSTFLSFSGLGLTVHFTDGTSLGFGPSYFTAHSSPADGGFDGGDFAIGGANPLPDFAQLTGLLSPTSATLNDGSSVSLQSSLVVTTLGSIGGGALSDGDIAPIYAQTGTGSVVPEPSYRALLPILLAGAAFAARKRLISNQGGTAL